MDFKEQAEDKYLSDEVWELAKKYLMVFGPYESFDENEEGHYVFTSNQIKCSLVVDVMIGGPTRGQHYYQLSHFKDKSIEYHGTCFDSVKQVLEENYGL